MVKSVGLAVFKSKFTHLNDENSSIKTNSWAKETKKPILRDNPTHANEEKKRSEYYDILHAPYISKDLLRIYKRNYAISTLE